MSWTYTKLNRKAEATFQALLARAFNGDLTATAAAEETAIA